MCEDYETERLPAGHTVGDILDQMLARCYGIWRVAATEANKTTLEEFWVEVVDAQGNVRVEPSKWHALEAAMRADVFDMAARMEDLGIAERQAAVAERMAELIEPILTGVLADLKLTPKQRERAPVIVQERLELLEGGKVA